MDLDDLNFRNPIKIGYYDPFNVLPSIREEIESKWPITNLHWKYYTAKSVKSIPLLPVTFIEEIPKPSLELSNISDDRYIRMMFVKYDNVDSYRSQIRPLIREWLKSLVSKSNVEWLIVLVIPSSSKYKESTLIKTSVYDKLKNDFGIEGKELVKLAFENNARYDLNVDRCFRVNEQYDNEIDKIEIFSEFTRVCKDALIRTFNNKQTAFQAQLDAIANESHSSFKSFLIKLNYAKFLGDIRLLKEAEDMYGAVSLLLPEVWSAHSEIFDLSFSFPNDINSYRLEYAFDTAAVFHQINSYDPKSLMKLNLGDLRCLIFVNQSAVLQSLANLANTISISALYISNLFRDLLKFIDSLRKMFELDPKGNRLELYQFLFAVIDFYLRLPISEKVIEVTNASNNNGDGNGDAYQLHEIYELKGELKLVQRSLLNDLGRLCSYKRTDDIMDSIDIGLEDSLKHNSNELRFKSLFESMKDNDSFFDAFEKLTESAIQDFLIAGRSKTIDVLSIDLVILHYKRGNYRLAFDVLQDSYEFFIEHKWNFMGGMLLEIYIHCKEKLGDYSASDLITPNIQLLSLLSDSKLSQGNINCYRITKSPKQVEEILSGVILNSNDLHERQYYPLDWLFSCEISPYIHPDLSTSLDRYYLDIDIKNSLGIDINAKNVSVLLRSNDNDTMIEFKSDAVSVSLKGSTIRVFTTFFKMATFTVESTRILLTDTIEFVEKSGGNLTNNEKGNATVVRFSKSIVAEDFHDSILYHDDRSDRKDTRIHFYQSLDKLWCEYAVPSLIQLGSSELVLSLHNQNNLIKNVSLELQELTAGLKFNRDSISSKLDRDLIAQGETWEIGIPYSYFSDSKIISVGCEVSYYVGVVKYTHIMRQEIDTTLTVSVSVQDIFKPNCLFLNFQICTANSKFPVKLISCEANCENSSYTIQEPKLKPSNVITFGEQPVSVFYRILLKESSKIQLNDKIDLCVVYSNIKDECIQIILQQVKKRLSQKGLLSYWFVVADVISKQVRFDLNHYAINKIIRVLNAMEILIMLEKIVARSIEREDDRLKVISIMKSGLSDTDNIPPVVEFSHQRLMIPVSIPTLRFLHRARYDFSRSPFYLVGEPIRVNLIVESILKWASGLDLEDQVDISVLAESSPGKDVSNDKILESVDSYDFTISIPNDLNWLVSGFKKKTLNTETVNRIEIVLVPLAVGKLHLPRVLIKSPEGSHSNGNSFTSNSNNNIEVEVANGAETLLVLSEQEAISFAF